MYVIKHEKFTLLPLAYNEFCNDINSLRDLEDYAGDIKVERYIDDKALESIVDCCSKDCTLLYVIDMKDIISNQDKIFKKLLGIRGAKILIVNIGKNLFDGISEDLKDVYEKIDSETLCSNSHLEGAYEELRNEIHSIYQKESVATVDWMKQNVKKENIENLKPLDSSGIYCNMYINAKRLFVEPDRYYFIIYQLICLIVKSDREVDAFVSASRNGANIAVIIGWLLNKKVIHCTNLGPKFSLAANSVYKDIRKNSKYIYIFDFMCLGTEVKLLNALLNFKGANLIAGYGIANYTEIENVSQSSLLAKMRSLVNVQKEEIGYRVAGSKEEIKGMLIEENRVYDFGVCRV